MASASRASRPMRASITCRGTLPLRNPGTRTSRDSRLAVRSIAGRSSSGSTTTLIRTLVGSTGSRVLRTGASGSGPRDPSTKLGKCATGEAVASRAPGRTPPGPLTERRPVYPRISDPPGPHPPVVGAVETRGSPFPGSATLPTRKAYGPRPQREPVGTARDRAAVGVGGRSGVAAGRGGGSAGWEGGRGGHAAGRVLARGGDPAAAGRRAPGVRQGGRARTEPRQPRHPPPGGPRHGRPPPLGPRPPAAVVARPARLGGPGVRGRGRRPARPALAARRARPGPGDGGRHGNRPHPGPGRDPPARRPPPGRLGGLAPPGRRRRRPQGSRPVGGPTSGPAGRPGGRLARGHRGPDPAPLRPAGRQPAADPDPAGGRRLAGGVGRGPLGRPAPAAAQRGHAGRPRPGADLRRPPGVLRRRPEGGDHRPGRLGRVPGRRVPSADPARPAHPPRVPARAGRDGRGVAAAADRLAVTATGNWMRGRPNFCSRGAGPSAPVERSEPIEPPGPHEPLMWLAALGLSG